MSSCFFAVMERGGRGRGGCGCGGEGGEGFGVWGVGVGGGGFFVCLLSSASLKTCRNARALCKLAN